MEQMNHTLSRLAVAVKHLCWNRYLECAFEFTTAHNAAKADREVAWMRRDVANVRSATHRDRARVQRCALQAKAKLKERTLELVALAGEMPGYAFSAAGMEEHEREALWFDMTKGFTTDVTAAFEVSCSCCTRQRYMSRRRVAVGH